MDGLSYSWIAACAISPLAVVVTIWCIYVYHSYKKRWRTVDVFLVALLSQQLLCSFFAFAFSVINMTNNRTISQICMFVLWGLTAIRTLQILTLTSMAVDRALTLRWPYSYRFSVRRNQIRYHISVLAIISIFVGVAAIFARQTPAGDGRCPVTTRAKFYGISTCCSMYPKAVNLKFSLFIVSFYGFMTFLSFAAILHIIINKCKSRRQKSLQLPETAMSWPMARKVLVPYEYPEPKDVKSSCMSLDSIGTTKNNMSMSSRDPSVGSCTRNKDKKPADDLRWSFVVIVVAFCYIVTHLPFLALTVTSLYVNGLWSALVENLITWLHLSEAFIVPIILFAADSTYREAVQRVFYKPNSDSSFQEDERRYGGCHIETTNLKFTEKSDMFDMSFPVSPMIQNYRRKPGSHKGKKRKPNYRNALRVDIPSEFSSNSVLWNQKGRPSYVQNVYNIDKKVGMEKEDLCQCDSGMSLSRLPSMESDINKDSSVWDRMDDSGESTDHIYATLSEIKYPIDEKDSLESFDYDSEDSCTTSANDDFEFVKSRYSMPKKGRGVTVIMIEEPVDVDDRRKPRFGYNDGHDADDEESLHELAFSLSENMRGIPNPGFNAEQNEVSVYRVTRDPNNDHLKSSLSMNNLDSIDTDINCRKSDSTSSLFKKDTSKQEKKLNIHTNLGNLTNGDRPQHVLSIDTLMGALNNSGVSYLDTGDVYQHEIEKKVTLSEFI